MKRTPMPLAAAVLLAEIASTPHAWAQAEAEAPAPEPQAEELATLPVSEPAAEAPEGASEERTVGNRLVEEIIVTAQKREEKLQDVPISIQAFSGDALAARGVESTAQLGQSIPSLQFTNVAGFTLIYMRGIGTDQFIPSADPSIATYIDGIYVPAGHTLATSLGNVQRVEVLKGPQGTLFGRNSTGGAISVVTADPGDSYEMSVEGERANFDTRQVKASVSGPVTDWLSIGVDGLYSNGANYYRNVNYEVPRDKFKAGRVKAHLHPIEDLSLSLTAYKTKQSGLGSVLGQQTDPSLLGTTLGIQPADDNFDAESDFVARVEGEQEIYYGTLAWKTQAFDVKLLGSDVYILTDFASIDFDGSSMPFAAFDTSNEYTKMKTAELQILSNDETWGSDKLQWVGGLYYLKSKAGFDPAHLHAAPQAFTSLQDSLGLPLPDYLNRLIADVSPLDFSPLEDEGLNLEFGGLLATKSVSAFFQGTYYFTDWMDLTLGGRLQKEKRYLTKSQTGALDPVNGNYVPVFSFPLPSETAKNFSPKAVLSFRPREDALVYLSYSAGFKSGTYNVVNIYQAAEYIEPEKVTTYEIGSKLELLDGRLRVNGALFWNDIDNLQSGFVSLFAGGVVRFQTAGAARTRGAELEGTFLPLPGLDPGLALSGNVAYVDAVYTDFENGSGFREDTGLYAENLTFTGNRIVRTPKWSGGVGAVQTIETSSGYFEIGVDSYFNAGFYYDASNAVEEKSYSIWNARLGYCYEPWNLRATLFGKNLSDERYHVQQFQTDFGVTKTLAPPRQYGVRVAWEF